MVSDVRYELSERGRAVAADLLERGLYLGPAPVSLTAYQEQVLKQRITNEQLDKQAIEDCFEGLIIPDFFTRQIGPAINSGSSNRPMKRPRLCWKRPKLLFQRPTAGPITIWR